MAPSATHACGGAFDAIAGVGARWAHDPVPRRQRPARARRPQVPRPRRDARGRPEPLRPALGRRGLRAAGGAGPRGPRRCPRSPTRWSARRAPSPRGCVPCCRPSSGPSSPTGCSRRCGGTSGSSRTTRGPRSWSRLPPPAPVVQRVEHLAGAAGLEPALLLEAAWALLHCETSPTPARCARSATRWSGPWPRLEELAARLVCRRCCAACPPATPDEARYAATARLDRGPRARRPPGVAATTHRPRGSTGGDARLRARRGTGRRPAPRTPARRPAPARRRRGRAR